MAMSFLSWKNAVSHNNLIILIKSMSTTPYNFLFKGRPSWGQVDLSRDFCRKMCLFTQMYKI